MAKVLGNLIRHFSNYYTLHRSDLAARAAPLDPRLSKFEFRIKRQFKPIKSHEFQLEHKNTVFGQSDYFFKILKKNQSNVYFRVR